MHFLTFAEDLDRIIVSISAFESKFKTFDSTEEAVEIHPKKHTYLFLDFRKKHWKKYSFSVKILDCNTNTSIKTKIKNKNQFHS